MRMPFAPDSMFPMVNSWLKFLHPLTGLDHIAAMVAVGINYLIARTITSLFSGLLQFALNALFKKDPDLDRKDMGWDSDALRGGAGEDEAAPQT